MNLAISGSWNYKDIEDGYESSYSGSLSYAYNYDAEGQLVAMDMSDNETSIEEGTVYSYKWKSKNVLTWKDGNLVRSEVNSASEDKEGSDVYVSTGKFVMNITYGNLPNKYRQYPDWFCDDEINYMAVGLLGVGPKMLPQRITESYKEIEDGHIDFEHEYDWTGMFTLNDNGTINTEKWVDSDTARDYYMLTYHYIPVGAASSAKADIAPAPLTRSSARAKIKRIRKALSEGLFMPHGKANR